MFLPSFLVNTYCQSAWRLIFLVLAVGLQHPHNVMLAPVIDKKVKHTAFKCLHFRVFGVLLVILHWRLCSARASSLVRHKRRKNF